MFCIKLVKKLLLSLHIFVGLGALAGGSAAILHPQAPLGVSVEILKASPFHNFFIPGLLLFTVIGLGNLFAGAMFRCKTKYQGYISSIFSWALVIWIVVQCIMLRSVVFLHILYFVIGLVQAALSAALLLEQQLFPANIALSLYRRFIKREA